MVETGQQIGISRESGTVLKTAAVVTPILVIEHPEIADMYRDTSMTQTEIALTVIPEIAEEFPSAARAAVVNALGKVMPKNERAEITTNRRKAVGSRNLRGNMTDEEFVLHQKAASKARHEKHGVDVEAMARGKGVTLWSETEQHFAQFLRSQSAYSHQRPNLRGKPDFSRIAQALNDAFHQGQPIRDRNSVRGLFYGRR